MEAHSLKYSQGYKAKKGYTFWEKDFDGMAFKTMLRQLISKWGIMSIDMQTAMDSDMGVIRDDGSVDYVDYADEDDESTTFTPAPENIVETEAHIDADADEVGNGPLVSDVQAALFNQTN